MKSINNLGAIPSQKGSNIKKESDSKKGSDSKRGSDSKKGVIAKKGTINKIICFHSKTVLLVLYEINPKPDIFC